MLNQKIDHTLLKPDATYDDIEKLCNEALDFKFYSVCVNPCYVYYARSIVKDELKVCSVINYPYGACTLTSQLWEVKSVIADGADEVDIVMPIGMFLSEKYTLVESNLRQLVSIAQANSVLSKIIIETALLKDVDKIRKACKIVEDSGADFVKTSTGLVEQTKEQMFSAITVIKDSVGDRLQIKAAGGIKDYTYAKELLDLGVHRIGSSSSINIVSGH